MSSEKLSLCSPEEMCIQIPLYVKFSLEDISEEQLTLLAQLSGFKGPVTCYCSECRQDSIFKKIEQSYPFYVGGRDTQQKLKSENFIYDHSIEIQLPCIRDENHPKASFYFQIHGNTLIKVGQYPSIADLSIVELKKYQKVLQAEDCRELSRSVGLAAHGIGIGSFVYLRRIFERLIFEVKQRVCLDGVEINEDEFSRGTMDVKIKLLKDHLPLFLVENQGIYGILSKGIHELH